MSDNPMTEAIRGVLGGLLEQGAEPPIYLAAVAANGSMMFAHYRDNGHPEHLETEVLAQHIDAPGFALPVNLMFTTTTGDAYRVVVNLDGYRLLH